MKAGCDARGEGKGSAAWRLVCGGVGRGGISGEWCQLQRQQGKPTS